MSMFDKGQVAQIILAQLGGRRFTTMTGATNLTSDVNWLSFKLPRGVRARDSKQPITHVKIVLDLNDLYTMIFMNCRMTSTRIKQDTIETHSDVYAEDLQSIFTAVTGLDTHL